MECDVDLLMRQMKLFIILKVIFLFNSVMAEPNSETWSQMLWQDFKSPLTTDIKYVFAGSVGLTLGLTALEDQISDPTQNEIVEDKPLGSWSAVGDYAGQMIPNAIYAIGMWSSDQRTNAGLMSRATLMAAFTTNVLKYTVREPRPNYPHNKEAFPSGHTATAFAFASVVACRHSLPWAVSSYALAGLVAFSRMNDNAHVLHDVVGGAAIGLGYGWGICWRQEALDGGKAASLQAWAVVPLEMGGEVVWEKRF